MACAFLLVLCIVGGGCLGALCVVRVAQPVLNEVLGMVVGEMGSR